MSFSDFYIFLLSAKCSIRNRTQMVKNLPATQETWVDPGVGKIPRRREWNPLQYSCMENPIDRGVRQAIVYGVTKSQTWLKWLTRSPSGHFGFCDNVLISVVKWCSRSDGRFFSPLLDACEDSVSQAEALERDVERVCPTQSSFQDPGWGAAPTCDHVRGREKQWWWEVPPKVCAWK